MRRTPPWTDLLLGLCVLGAGALFVAFSPAESSGLGAPGLGGAARLAFGFLGLLLVPGYAAAAALFPGRRDIDPVSRGALTLGLSVAAVPLAALLLNLTPWGIRPLPMALALLLLTALLSGMAVLRRRRAEEQAPSAAPQEPAEPSTRTTQLRRVHIQTTQVWATRVDAAPQATTARPPARRWPAEGSVFARPLLFALLAVTVATGVVGGLTVQQRAQQSFTEFYLLGGAGRLGGYPYRVAAQQPFEVSVGVLNRERLPARYTVRTLGCTGPGAGSGEIAVPRLEPGQAWTARVRCRVGADTTALQFQLVRGGSLEPYRTLTLRVQPTASGS